MPTFGYLASSNVDLNARRINSYKKDLSVKKLLTIILLTVICSSCATTTNKPKIVVEKRSPNFTNYRVEGSLEPTAPLSCVALNEIGNMTTPPDMFAGLAECVKNNKFDRAGRLLYMARLFGIYDAKRVADKTAGQGLTVLQMNTFSQIDQGKAITFQEYINNPKNKKNVLASICVHAKQIGEPRYYPKYMILHGIQAFTGINGDGLEPNFDAAKVWKSILERSCKKT